MGIGLELGRSLAVDRTLVDFLGRGDLRDAAGGHAGLLALLDGLQHDLRAAPDEQEAMARRIAQRLVLAAQAALMLRHAPQDVAEAFAASRLDGEGGRVYGTMAAPALQQRILDRAWAGV